MIKVRYSSIDRFSQTRSFATMAAARRFAQKWVGQNPEIGSHYAISGDGIGKITVTGATLAELFGADSSLPSSRTMTDQEAEDEAINWNMKVQAHYEAGNGYLPDDECPW